LRLFLTGRPFGWPTAPVCGLRPGAAISSGIKSAVLGLPRLLLGAVPILGGYMAEIFAGTFKACEKPFELEFSMLPNTDGAYPSGSFFIFTTLGRLYLVDSEALVLLSSLEASIRS